MSERAWWTGVLHNGQPVRHRPRTVGERIDPRTGKRRAMCGASLLGPYHGEEFDPLSPYSCKNCCTIGGFG